MEDKTMKKVFGFIALALSLIACNKEDIDLQTTMQPAEKADGITITATLASKRAGTKAVADGGMDMGVDADGSGCDTLDYKAHGKSGV